MTEEQRDDLIIELSLYGPTQIREMIEETRNTASQTVKVAHFTNS